MNSFRVKRDNKLDFPTPESPNDCCRWVGGWDQLCKLPEGEVWCKDDSLKSFKMAVIEVQLSVTGNDYLRAGRCMALPISTTLNK